MKTNPTPGGFIARTFRLSVPDQESLKISQLDKLTLKGVPAQVDRMIKDPRGKRMIHSFCNQWLDLRSFDQIAPSLKLYPLYNDLLNHYLPLKRKPTSITCSGKTCPSDA